MYKLNKRILISGCGLSFSGQERKTWANIFKVAGIKMTDVGGPAVSNQWILNKVILELWANRHDTVIIQLTGLGKLDVEVNDERHAELVINDPIRNFVYQNVWPSSVSNTHLSKQLYYKWLSSPNLETEDLVCKLLLLKCMCDQFDIDLHVFQGYLIPWNDQQKELLDGIIYDLDSDLYSAYPNSEHYQFHDHTNTVPCLSYQFFLAKTIAGVCYPEALDKINKMLAKSKDVVLS
jgi:hypothetical protein